MEVVWEKLDKKNICNFHSILFLVARISPRSSHWQIQWITTKQRTCFSHSLEHAYKQQFTCGVSFNLHKTYKYYSSSFALVSYKKGTHTNSCSNKTNIQKLLLREPDPLHSAYDGLTQTDAVPFPMKKVKPESGSYCVTIFTNLCLFSTFRESWVDYFLMWNVGQSRMLICVMPPWWQSDTLLSYLLQLLCL